MENENTQIVSDEQFNKNEEKKVVKNFFGVAISNFIKLVSSILVGFLIPKIMGVSNYGYYKTFTLYYGYVYILSIGFCEGIYLTYTGFHYKELDEKKMRALLRFFSLMQIIVTFIVMLISIFFMKQEYGFIIFSLGFALLIFNILNYYMNLSTALQNFKELSFMQIVGAAATLVAVGIFATLYFTGHLHELNYRIYILVIVGITLFQLLYYLIKYRSISFGKRLPISEIKSDIKELFKIGFPLLIANLISTLLMSVDRQFVNMLFTNDEYGIYSFAYNMITAITTVISAVSTVLYPHIKQYSWEKQKKSFNFIIMIISILTALCLLAYFPLYFIVEHFLPDYIYAMRIFRIILPSLLFSNAVTLVIFNFFKALGKSFHYFVIGIIMLAIAIIADAVAYIIAHSMLAISAVSVGVMGLWLLITMIIMIKEYKVNPLKNIIYLLLILVGFYTVAFLFDNYYIGCAIYGGIFIIISAILFAKPLINKMKKI